MRERVLEGVLELGKESGLVEEFSGPQACETEPQRVLPVVHHGMQEVVQHVLPDDGRGLEEPLVLGRQSVDARRKDRLGGRRDLKRLERFHEAGRAAVAREGAGLDERSNALLQEEWIALGSIDQEALERQELVAHAEQGLEKLFGALDRERIDAEQPVIHEHQDLRRRKALDDSVEQRLRLPVDPVEVLEYHDQRLDLRFAQKKSFEAVERALPSLRRIESHPFFVVDRNIEECQERWQRRLERAVEREQLAGHPLADPSLVVRRFDLEVRSQQLDHRQVARRLAVGDGPGLDDQTALGAVRVRELPEQPRLAHAGLTDYGDHLALAGLRLREGGEQSIHLGVAADEGGQTPGRRGLQARAYRARPGQLEDLGGRRQPLDRDCPERLDSDETLRKVQRVRRQQNRARVGHLLHARGEVRSLSHGGVIHVQV